MKHDDVRVGGVYAGASGVQRTVISIDVDPWNHPQRGNLVKYRINGGALMEQVQGKFARWAVSQVSPPADTPPPMVSVPSAQFEALMTVARAVETWTTCGHGETCEHIEEATEALEAALGDRSLLGELVVDVMASRSTDSLDRGVLRGRSTRSWPYHEWSMECGMSECGAAITFPSRDKIQERQARELGWTISRKRGVGWVCPEHSVRSGGPR